MNIEQMVVRAAKLYDEYGLTKDTKTQEQALLAIDYAVARDPHHPGGLWLYGRMLSDGGAVGAAIQVLMKAREASQSPPILHLLGHLLLDEGHPEAAQQVLKEACKADPENARGVLNLAASYVNTGQPQIIIDLCNRALHMNKNRKPGVMDIEPETLYHKSLGLLEAGVYTQGFADYEHRFSVPAAKNYKRPYPWPKWDGKPVRRLLVHGEQGIGDEVLFASWLAKVPADQLMLEVTPRLIPTFKRSFPNAQVFGTAAEIMPSAVMIDGMSTSPEPPDAVCGFGSLPHLLGWAEQGEMGYMRPDMDRVEAYRERLRTLGPGPYIGLSWSGGKVKTHGFLRNAALELWKPLTKHGTCVSVQYGQQSENAAALGIPHWPEAVDDIDEMMALLSALDLVISVNNSTVHFCGALDVPCWTLTPSAPAWRYGMTGDKMRWYDSVRQFRQKGLGEKAEWAPVYERVEDELAAFCAMGVAA